MIPSKKMNHILYVEDANGQMLDFWRWSYKRPQTVLDKALGAFRGNADFWRRQFPAAAQIAIYATPDGYNHNSAPALVMPWESALALAKPTVARYNNNTGG